LVNESEEIKRPDLSILRDFSSQEDKTTADFVTW